MPDISELTAGERDLVAVHLGQLVAAGVDVNDPDSLGKFYDTLHEQWAAMSPEPRDNPDAVINLIGIGLGECLVRRAEMEWVVESSEGAQLAVYGADNDVLVYPTNAVAKRWIEGVQSFIPEFVDEVIKAAS